MHRRVGAVGAVNCWRVLECIEMPWKAAGDTRERGAVGILEHWEARGGTEEPLGSKAAGVGGTEMHYEALGFTGKHWNVLGGIGEHGEHRQCWVWGQRGTG